MGKSWIITVVVAVIIGIAAFAGGMVYGQSKPPSVEEAMEALQNANPEDMQQAFQGGGGFPGGPGSADNGTRGGGGAGGGLVSGDIVAQDAQSITVKLPDGSSKIVLYSGSTTISKSATGSASDLTTGTGVMVTGTTNTDGSVTATRIQIRGADELPFGPGGAPDGTATTQAQ